MKNTCKIFRSKMFSLVCCNFSKSQGGKIQILLELSYHSHLKKEGMTAAITDHRRRGGRSKPYSSGNEKYQIFLDYRHFKFQKDGIANLLIPDSALKFHFVKHPIFSSAPPPCQSYKDAQRAPFLEADVLTLSRRHRICKLNYHV